MTSRSYLSTSAHRRDIDGLRGIAIIAVVAYHAFPAWLGGGFTGVDVFFVISGFLISSIIIESLKRDAFSFTDFYVRRVRRIFPALALMLVTVYGAGWIVLFPHEFRQLSEHIAYGAGFASNFLLLQESGYFDNEAITKPLLHLWSLGIEEQYYIVWPMMLWLGWKWRINLGAIVIVIATVSFALNVIQLPGNPVATFYSPQTRIWELMIGSLLACLQQGPIHGAGANGATAKNAGTRGNLIALLGATLVFIGMTIDVTPTEFPGWRALLPTLGAALFIAAGPQAWLNRAVLSNRLLTSTGLISYPLYLWHWPLLSFAHIIDGATPAWSIRAAAIGAAVLLAWLTTRLVERPLRHGEHGQKKALALLLLILAIGAVGTIGMQQDRINARPGLQDYVATRERIDGQFIWKYARNDLCLKRYWSNDAKQSAPSFCMTNKDEKPTLLLLGNSFANQLYPGLATNDRFKGHSILNIGDCGATAMGSCGDVYGLRQRRDIDDLIEHASSVKFAIIAGISTDIAPAEIDRLIARIARLQTHGIKVIVFMPHLHVTDITAKPDFEIKTCFSSRPFQHAVSCEFETDIRNSVATKFLPVVRRIQTANPQVLFFDPNELFCKDRQCRLTDDGKPLFRDRGHFSEHGSVLLAELFAGWAATNLPELLETETVQESKKR